SVINRDVIEALPRKFDVLLYDRPDETCIQQSLNAGLLAVIPAGKDFVDFVAAYLLSLEESPTTMWFADQMAMVAPRARFKQNVPDIDIQSSPPRFMDWSADFNPDSVVWTAKGKRKNALGG